MRLTAGVGCREAGQRGQKRGSSRIDIFYVVTGEARLVWSAGAVNLAPEPRGRSFASQKSASSHAAFFVEFGPRDPDGKASIVVMDQWTDATKKAVSARTIPRRGVKLHSEGNIYDNSDNAEYFYVVK